MCEFYDYEVHNSIEKLAALPIEVCQGTGLLVGLMK